MLIRNFLMTGDPSQESDEQKTIIKKLYREILFWVLFPIMVILILLLLGKDLNNNLLIGALLCFTIPLIGIWAIYRAKKNSE